MIMHFLSTGPKFPYSYYLGVMTALKAHKGRVILWITEEPESWYFDLLRDKIEIKRVKGEVPDFPALRDRDDHFRRCAIFDYLIWRILYRHGGILMGLDSISLKDWQDLLPPDKEIMLPIDDDNYANQRDKFRCYSMHGVIVRKQSLIVKAICADSIRALNLEQTHGPIRAVDSIGLRWGGAGIIPYLNNAAWNMDKAAIVEFGLVGGYKHDGSPLYLYEKGGKLLHPDARTIPLYASFKSKSFAGINENFVASSGTLYSKLVKKSLLPSEWDTRAKVIKSRKFRFHLLGLSHLPCDEQYMACAFSMKILKMAKMLKSLGHTVFYYGAEGSQVECDEFIQTHTLKDIRDSYGEGDNRFELGYDYKRKGFKHDFNKTRSQVTLKYYLNSIDKINKRKQDDDFLLLTQGVYQKPIANSVKLFLTCEPGVGYRGSYSRFRAFESSYLQNFTYGFQKKPLGGSFNGNYYDRVIPNYFDPKDFEYREKKDDYFLFIGRLIVRKGIIIAHLVTKAMGAKLKIAGQGMKSWGGKKLVGEDFNIEGDNLDFVGCVDVEERKKLYSHAKATFVPTVYLESFGGVSIESLFSGTPVISTNFGVFPGTIPHGVVGYRCDTLNDFIVAAKNIEKIEPKTCRDYAMKNFSMDQVRWQFEKWFQDLYDLYESAKDPRVKGWHRIYGGEINVQTKNSQKKLRRNSGS